MRENHRSPQTPKQKHSMMFYKNSMDECTTERTHATTSSLHSLTSRFPLGCPRYIHMSHTPIYKYRIKSGSVKSPQVASAKRLLALTISHTCLAHC